MKIEQIISDAAVKAVKALYGIEAAPGTTVPQKTKKEFEGNLTLVVFPFLKASHKAPEATAQEIGEYLLANEPAVASFNVIKGFLNLVIAPSFWSQLLRTCSFGHGRIFLAQYQQTVTFGTCAQQLVGI